MDAHRNVYKFYTKGWEKGDFLGEGCFGKVYRWENPLTGGKRAVKEISKDSSKAQTLKDEFALLKSLSHGNVVRCHDWTEDGFTYYMHMELLEGSVKDKVMSSNGLTHRLTGIYTIHILKGLEYLHAQGVVHRDIKCENVLLDKQGTAKLADMGLAKHCTADAYDTYYSAKGCVPWMSPEALQRRKAERRADVWSVGCTVNEMLKGEPPLYFMADSQQEFIEAAARMKHAEVVMKDKMIGIPVKNFMLRIFVPLFSRPYVPELLRYAEERFIDL